MKEGLPRRLHGLAGNAGASGLPAGHPPIDSLLLVPLISAMRSCGWLYLANPRGGEGFGEIDEQIATTLAAKLAMAYDNLFLYGTLQLYAARLEEDSEAIKRLNAGLEQQVNARQISETRFRMAMEAGTTLAYTLDSELRYAWIHSCRSGFDLQAAIGKTDFCLFTEETASPLTALYRQAIATGARLRSDVTVRRRPESADKQFDLVVEPLQDAGQVTGIICAAVDITERKRGEADLLAAKAEAERANDAKSRFLAAASHDLRQPLAALNLYIDSMMRSKTTIDPRVALVNMKSCVTSLNEMLSDLLDLSKLEAGVTTPAVSDFCLHAMLGKVATVHAPDARAKGLALRCAPTTLAARTDPVLFGRVVGNFLANAVRYTERGGVLVGCRRRQGKVWVEVWDTGIGIPEDKTTEIFEEFRQLDNDARDRSRRSGLGLSIAAKTAALLGLQIQVRSRPGRGSMFAIEVPLGRSVATSAKRERPCGRLRIGLVEDDRWVFEALVQALSTLGHQVIAAASGRELLAGLGGSAPDLVISDYRLAGGETGFDVVASVRTAFGKEVPALVITGDTDPGLICRVAGRGIVIRHKPVSIETLQACIAELTEGEYVVPR
jgi:two-component system, sensor histidine kinase